MSKKNIPLSVLKALEPFVGLKDKLFTIENRERNILFVRDIDSSSKFYYTIESSEISDGEELFTIVQAPKNEKELKAFAVKIYSKDLKDNFNSWIQLLENYNKVKSFFDDPILESYEEEFYTNFELVDEDADTRPFSTTQILQLDYLLEQVSTRLINMADGNNREQIETIITDITEVRESLPTRPQKWIAEHISKIFAKIAKQGINFIKEFWAEGKKELIKNIVKGLVEAGTELIN
ncbi:MULTISPECIES: hypothetical protein [unclassified Chryseobacterium]|uniref:hypothetical protein n=1 Tax=unclassified Chryseobacterium TaxID=2593645 RepID=UPI0028533614|nr:hypothetical protein [Chryseobacterium sp. CFS7]MDR4892288.1 hypothetical protein [Chryseobacterium sp. CFS7]